MKKTDGGKQNIIHYGNLTSILSVLSLVAVFVVVCAGIIWLLGSAGVINIPAFISGNGTTRPNPSEGGKNLLDALTDAGVTYEKNDGTFDSEVLRSVLSNHSYQKPYTLTGTFSYRGRDYEKSYRFFVCVDGERYRVDIYDGVNEVRSIIYNGSNVHVIDENGEAYLSHSDYFNSDAAIPMPSLYLLCRDGDYEFLAPYIDPATGDCICSGRYRSNGNIRDEYVISTVYGVITQAKTYYNDRLIYSCEVMSVITNIENPDSFFN